MHHSKNVIIRSTDEKDDIALGLIDGKLKLRVGTGKRGSVDLAAVSKAELTLAYANELHARGCHREAFGYAVRAAREVFEAVGTNKEMHEPYKHLMQALSDLYVGRLDRALDPGKVANRKIEPSSEWDARACLAAALEARMALGEKEQVAAEQIRKKFSVFDNNWTVERSRAVNRLVDWRKQFRSRKPPAGQIRFDTALKLIEVAKTVLDERARRSQLSHYEEKLLTIAEECRARLS